MPNRVLLIDGDIIAYRAAAAAEHPVNWGDHIWSLHASEDDVTRAVDDYHDALMAKLDADHAVYALTDSARNWRYDVLPTYKHNRAETRRPMLLAFAREYLLTNFETYLRPRLEGDDVLGILSTHRSLVKAKEKILVSIDKDMQTIPGLYFNDAKDTEPREVTEAEADYWHMFQTLTGDSTDGYGGCPGVGPVAAKAILDDPRLLVEEAYEVSRGKNKGEVRTRWVDAGPAPRLWDAVVCQYQKAGLTEEDALIQARVARICRASDYNFNEKKVKLWTPTPQPSTSSFAN